ncbi:hypothetical protein EYF80_021006 [Liparis tanakae]|uniref:Uncharacterized protein n=1 Tax=Liparis tanakae TaxID=230148 RepID=A0A4Z2HST1_9TELE|nr:hypothetical protein EYF80_021006 [Liparis tanakae]
MVTSLLGRRLQGDRGAWASDMRSPNHHCILPPGHLWPSVSLLISTDHPCSHQISSIILFYILLTFTIAMETQALSAPPPSFLLCGNLKVLSGTPESLSGLSGLEEDADHMVCVRQRLEVKRDGPSAGSSRENACRRRHFHI